MDLRDWKQNPPKTREEGFEFALSIATQVCDNIALKYGERPRPVRNATGYVIVWPDGEATNQIDVEMLQ